MFNQWNEELKIFFFKIIIPALVAVSVKLAIEGQRTKMNTFNVLSSFVIGVGVAYLSGDLVLAAARSEAVSPIVAIIALAAEKIASFILFKFRIDKAMLSVLEYLSGLIKKG